MHLIWYLARQEKKENENGTGGGKKVPKYVKTPKQFLDARKQAVGTAASQKATAAEECVIYTSKCVIHTST